MRNFSREKIDEPPPPEGERFPGTTPYAPFKKLAAHPFPHCIAPLQSNTTCLTFPHTQLENLRLYRAISSAKLLITCNPPATTLSDQQIVTSNWLVYTGDKKIGGRHGEEKHASDWAYCRSLYTCFVVCS